MAGAGELLGCCQTGRTGPDDGGRLEGVPLGDNGNDATVLPRLVDDRDLDVLDRHRVTVDSLNAGSLAGGRTQATGELREVVGRQQRLQCLAPLVTPDEVVPVRDEVAQRAPGVAERHTTVHAPTGLISDDRQQGVAGASGVDLLPVMDALLDPTTLCLLSRHLHETVQISHGTPP